jgi:3-hydroxybutyryl-CoA dehydratase
VEQLELLVILHSKTVSQDSDLAANSIDDSLHTGHIASQTFTIARHTMARGTYFSDFNVGDAFKSVGRTVTESDVCTFAGLSGDFNPLHTDATFAAKTPFGQRIAHGMLIASISTGLGQTLGIFEGTTLALMEQSFKYKAPVFFGDTVHMKLIVEAVKPSSKGGKGVVSFRSEIIKQDDTVVNIGSWTVMFRDRK